MNENYSRNAQDFINEVEEFSKEKLNKKIELLRLYEEALINKKENVFDEITFTAKYLRGLMRVLQSGKENPEVQNLELIKKDFSSNLEKIIDKIKDIISNSDENLKEHFKNNFFVMTQDGLININELLSDLEWVKIYLNEQKRSRKN